MTHTPGILDIVNVHELAIQSWQEHAAKVAAERDRLREVNRELVAALEAVEPFMRVWLKKFPKIDGHHLEVGGPDEAHLTQADAKRICAALAKARKITTTVIEDK